MADYYAPDPDTTSDRIRVAEPCDVPVPENAMRAMDALERYQENGLRLGGDELRSYVAHMHTCTKRHRPGARVAYNVLFKKLQEWEGGVASAYILGPVVFACYTRSSTQPGPPCTVYLFGERHDKHPGRVTVADECAGARADSAGIHIATFLSEWLKRAPGRVDLFIERGRHVSSRLVDTSTFLSDVRFKFRSCSTANWTLQQQCYYEAARVHSVDLRGIRMVLRERVCASSQRAGCSVQEAHALWMTPELYAYFKRAKEQLGDEDMESIKVQWRDRVIDLIFNVDARNALLASFFDQVKDAGDARELIDSELSRIAKAVHKIPSEDLRSRLFYGVLDKWTDSVVPALVDWFAWIRAGNRPSRDVLTAQFESFSMLFFSVFMDIYMVARMFSAFDGEQPRNLIVYAGKLHIFRVMQMLELIGFIKRAEFKTFTGSIDQMSAVDTAPPACVPARAVTNTFEYLVQPKPNLKRPFSGDSDDTKVELGGGGSRLTLCGGRAAFVGMRFIS
jgi:hypothetical protein